MEAVTVSVCIPTYNGARDIATTLDYIKAQTYDNIEIIVTDDCSDDDTVKIIEERYPEVIVRINEKRLGLTGNWNRAVSLATGKYIKLMGQDDIIGPDTIRLQVEALEQHPNASMCIGQTDVINVDGSKMMTRKLANKDFCCDGKKFARKSLWYRNIYCEPSNVLYRADIQIPYNSDYIYVPDWDHNIAVSLHGDVYYVAQKLMDFRVSNSSETSRLYRSKMNIMNEDHDRLINAYRKELKIPVWQYLFFRFSVRMRTLIRYIFIHIKVR